MGHMAWGAGDFPDSKAGSGGVLVKNGGGATFEKVGMGGNFQFDEETLPTVWNITCREAVFKKKVVRILPPPPVR